MMRRNISQAALAIALVAVLLRGLLPAGWMPNPAGAMLSPLVICTMDGPRRVAMPAAPNHSPSGDKHEDHASGPCPFAGAAPLAPPAETVDAIAPAFVGGIPAIPDRRIAHASARHRSYTARAPPTLA